MPRHVERWLEEHCQLVRALQVNIIEGMCEDHQLDKVRLHSLHDVFEDLRTHQRSAHRDPADKAIVALERLEGERAGDQIG